MYPNPVRTGESVWIQFQRPLKGMLQVTDLYGRIVMSVPVSGSSVELGTDALSSGIYFVGVFEKCILYGQKKLVVRN